MTTSQSFSWTDVAREATEHLNRLLSMSAGVAAGSELAAARYLLSVFESEGIPALILPPVSGSALVSQSSRPNLVAHLAGTGADEPLLLLSHLDSAPRSLAEWEPELIGDRGVFTGPGSLAGVHLSVAQAMALILLARSGAPLRRFVRYAATSQGIGGKGAGLAYLVKENLEHITSDLAIGWGGLNWLGSDGQPYSLLAIAEKGCLVLRLRSEGTGGRGGTRLGKDPVGRLVRALDKASRLEFPPRLCSASQHFLRSLSQCLPDSKSSLLHELARPHATAAALKALESDKEIDQGLKSLISASLSTESCVLRFEAKGNEGFVPRVAEADLAYYFLPGEDVEALARRVLESLERDGVYLAEKDVLPASESSFSPEVHAMARAALAEVDARAALIVGISPWPTGLGHLRRFGTSVFGWEPFAAAGTLQESLSSPGGPRERLEVSAFLKEIKALYSFLCRAAV